MPRWVPRAIIFFWLMYLATLSFRHVFDRLGSFLILLLISLFIALAVEPGVNRLVQRGWGRRKATAGILFSVVIFTLVFLGAVGTLVASQIADLAQNSEKYVNDTVEFINDTFNTNIDPAEVNQEINDPDGAVQRFIDSQQDRVFSLSLTALNGLLQALSVFLFSYYLVADGPRMRRAICSRLAADKQVRVLDTWDLAITKTGGYLYSRALLAGLSAFFHWIAFQAIGAPAPIASAVWVGLVSQFLPVIGTYLAGILPVLLTFIESPVKALIVIGFIVVYQQVENYLFAPRITARTLELHPALAFGAALAGAAVMGPVGAILALPAAAMAQALVSSSGTRHVVISNPLIDGTEPKTPKERKSRLRRNGGNSGNGDRRNDVT
jgi:predicted PurR-regulated permease PerM